MTGCAARRSMATKSTSSPMPAVSETIVSASFQPASADRTMPYIDWDGVANDAAAVLRFEAGRNPCERGLSDLAGELSTAATCFARSGHNVRSTTPAPSASTTRW
jgi:hypothetical protein